MSAEKDAYYASAWNFVIETFRQAGDPLPSGEAMDRAAQKIAKQLRIWAKELIASKAEKPGGADLIEMAFAAIRQFSIRNISPGDLARVLAHAREVVEVRLREIEGAGIAENLAIMTLTDTPREGYTLQQEIRAQLEEARQELAERTQAREAAESKIAGANLVARQMQDRVEAAQAGREQAEKERDEARAQEEYWHSAAKQLGIDYYTSQGDRTETEHLRVASVGRAEAAEHRAEAAEARVREVEETLRHKQALIESHILARDAADASAEYRLRELRAALEQFVFVIEAAGVLNLSNGVQLGQMSWAAKCEDALAWSKALLARTETLKEPTS